MKDVYYPGNRSDRKALGRDVRKGTVLYTVSEHALNLAPYEDQYVYNEHVVTHRAPITGDWMVDPTCSVVGLLGRYGAVYTQPPVGMRGSHQAPRQVAGPDPEKVARDAAKAASPEPVAAGGKRRKGWW